MIVLVMFYLGDDPVNGITAASSCCVERMADDGSSHLGHGKDCDGQSWNGVLSIVLLTPSREKFVLYLMKRVAQVRVVD